MLPNNTGGERIRPDDVLIERPEVQTIMGGMSVSWIYDEADLMSLKVTMTSAQGRTRAVRWIEREVLELRARRVARSEPAAVRAAVEQRRELRRAKQS